MNYKENNGLDDIKNICKSDHDGDIIDSRICLINYELKQGFELMKKYPKSVTIYGSARLPEDNHQSQNAMAVAKALAEKGYTVVTGGGYGVMGAANKGAMMAGGDSIGMNIELPFEQTMNQYTTDSLDFHHFYTRKVTLAYSAEAYIYFAGGFGTLDELFEMLTLKQTKKIPNIPIILFGSYFWKPLEEFFKEVLLGNYKTIAEEDLNLYTITDDIDEVVRLATTTTVRDIMSDRFCDLDK